MLAAVVPITTMDCDDWLVYWYDKQNSQMVDKTWTHKPCAGQYIANAAASIVIVNRMGDSLYDHDQSLVTIVDSKWSWWIFNDY